jgi:3-phenylpropionate/cinnamic acid dioxygenase small subunit
MSQGRETLNQAIRLVEREARLLDERRFDEWLSLFADDAWYWMPASWEQRSPDDALSLLYEDRRLLSLRVRRLSSPVIHVEQPPSRTHHHLSALAAESTADGGIEVSSLQLIVMVREADQRLFSARCVHRVRVNQEVIEIVSKTVRLLDCDAGHRGFAVPV